MWSPGITLEMHEREAILKALSWYRGNRTHAADALGITPKTLREKLKKYRKEGVAIPVYPGDTADVEKEV